MAFTTFGSRFDCKYAFSGGLCEVLGDIRCDMECGVHPCELCINDDDKEVCQDCIVHAIRSSKEEEA